MGLLRRSVRNVCKTRKCQQWADVFHSGHNSRAFSAEESIPTAPLRIQFEETLPKGRRVSSTATQNND